MKNIIVIFGGNSTEHDISVITGVEALHSMPIKGYNTEAVYLKDGNFYVGDALFDIEFYKNFNEKLLTKVAISDGVLYKVKKNKLVHYMDIDCALLATHGGDGEDGSLQGLLDLNGIPYTSSGTRECAICMDKELTKLVMRALGVRVVFGKGISQEFTDEELARIERAYNFPLVVKPCSQGSSIGISKVCSHDELMEGVKLASEFSDRILIEKGLVDFVEINSACVAINNKLILSELERPLSSSDILTFEEKYVGNGKGMGGGKHEFPAKISCELREKIRATTKKVYRELGLKGVVRIDYIVYKNIVFLNEINTIPGSLAHYLFDMSYTELLKGMIDTAIDNGARKKIHLDTGVLGGLKTIKK